MARLTIKQSELFGYLLMVISALSVALSAYNIKLVSNNYTSETIVFYRNVYSLLKLIIYGVFTGQISKIIERRDDMVFHIVRAIFAISAMYCFFFAASILPIGTAVILNFTSPLFVPLFGFLIFRYTINLRTLVLLLIGFVGIAFILLPSNNARELGLMIGIGSGIFSAVSVTIIWRTSYDTSPYRTATIFAFLSTVATFPFYFATSYFNSQIKFLFDPDLVLIAVFSTLAHYTFLKSCSFVRTDRVSILSYLSIPFSTVIGIYMFDDIISANFVIGSSIIVLSCIFMILHSGGK